MGVNPGLSIYGGRTSLVKWMHVNTGFYTRGCVWEISKKLKSAFSKGIYFNMRIYILCTFL